MRPRPILTLLAAALACAAAYLQAQALAELAYAYLSEHLLPPRPAAPVEAARRQPGRREPAAPPASVVPFPLQAAPSAPRGPSPAQSAAPATHHPGQRNSGLLQVRAVPEFVGGRVVGIQLSGVQDGSLLALLGLRSGDRLRRINGRPCDGPENLLRAYRELGSRNEFELEVELERDGAPLLILYHLR